MIMTQSHIFGVYEWVAANQLQLFCRRLDFERIVHQCRFYFSLK